MAANYTLYIFIWERQVFLLVEGFIPLCKPAQAFAQRGVGLEAEVFFECGGVGEGDGHVAGLHGNEFLVRLEVVVGREYAGGSEFLLQDLHEVQQVLGTVVADVIYLIGRDGEAVLAGLLFGGVLHDAHHSFHNVIDIGEVALAVAVVENLYRFALQELVGEAEVCHVGTAAGTIDGEEAQTGAGDVVELAVGVCHELVALFGGGIEAHGVVHLVVGAVGHLLVAAIDAGGGGIDQVFHLVVAAGLEDVVEADEVALDVGVGVGDAVAHAGLGRQVHHHLGGMGGEEGFDGLFVGDVPLYEGEAGTIGFEFAQAFVLQAHIVVVGDAVDADDFYVGELIQKAFHQIGSDEACRTGDQHGLVVQVYIIGYHYQSLWKMSRVYTFSFTSLRHAS